MKNDPRPAIIDIVMEVVMGENRSIFSEEWRACLRAHYMYVIRSQDTVTEPTLRRVLLQTGLTEDDLADLQRQALGHVLESTEASPEEPIEESAPAEETIIEPTDAEDLPPDSGQISMF